MYRIFTIILISMLLASCALKKTTQQDKALAPQAQNPNADIKASFDTNDYLDEALEELEDVE